MRAPKANGSYDIKKVREFIAELDRVLEQEPRPVIDNVSAHIMIRNLIESLKYAVNTLEYVNNEAVLHRLRNFMGKSSAKN